MSIDKKEQQKRQEMMIKIVKLRGMRCEKCKSDKEYAEKCKCDASVKLRGLSTEQDKLLRSDEAIIPVSRSVKAKVKKGESIVPVSGIKKTEKFDLTVEKYKGLKMEGVSDVEIMGKVGWHTVKMNEWKRDNDLIGKRFEKFENDPKVESESDWKVLYDSLKSEYDLNKTKYGYAQKELIEVGKELDESNTQLKSAELKFNSAFKDYQDLKESYNSLLEASAALQKEIERLKKYESDYKGLERYQKYQEDENQRLKEELKCMKNTETMNLLMMERYLDLNEKMNERLN